MIGARTLKKKGANCPSCGAPVAFRSGGTMVAVCEFCHSAIARGDRDVELIGKVSDLVETDSVVRLGSTGKYRGKPFECIGRVQYQHAAGGFWDEWYLRLPGDRVAWLADAQGQLQLTFPRRIDRRVHVPDFETVSLGDNVALGDTDLTVMEKGTATAVTAQGEIPWQFRPGGDHVYVDLRGHDDWFATIEYDAPKDPAGNRSLAIGKTVSLADLHLDAPAVEPLETESMQRVEAVQLNCPQCGGPLDVRMPDQTMRVGCPNCGALLDVNKGKLRILKTLDDRLVKPTIPLGSVGRFQFNDNVRDREFTLIGCMDRYAMYQGTAYPWREYLLHNPEIGFRWLVENDRHWSYVEPVTDGNFSHRYHYHHSLRYKNRTYRLFDRGRAYVRSCMGEFYWKVNQGDVVSTSDYVSPPYMLSFEASRSGSTEELNISHGIYLSVDEVKAAFGLKNLIRPWGVGPIQPSPAIHMGVWLSWVGFMAFITMMHVLGGVWFSSPGRAGPDPWMWFYAMIFVSLVPLGTIAYKYHFETQRWKNSDYNPYPTVES